MKLLLLVFFPFFSIAQDSTYEPGDSTWLTSSDTGKVKVYKLTHRMLMDPGAGGGVHFDNAQVIAYGYSDIIEPRWIDTFKAHGKTIHYTNKGNVVYKEEGRPNYNVSGKEKEAESVYDIYPDPISIYLNYTDELPPPAKYDTIGPFWKQVSDTTAGYNPVMAMQLYEVIELVNDWVKSPPKKNPVKIVKDKNGEEFRLYESTFYIEKHYAWLDIKKKPFKLFVWNDKTIAP